MNFLEILQILLIVAAGAVHLWPLMGILGAPMLKSMHHIDFKGAEILILMKHRAVMCGLIGFFMVYAAFDSYLQRIAIVTGLVNAGAFIAISKTTKPYNQSIRKTIHGFWIAICCLLVAALL